MATKQAIKQAIPGEGEFVLASNNLQTTLIVRSLKQDHDDLVMPPEQEVAVDYDYWRMVPHFARDVRSKKISVRRSEDVPEDQTRRLNSEYERELTPDLRQLALLICNVELDDQLLSAIRLPELLGDTGMPKKGVKATKAYLKGTHTTFLKAIRELESRWKKRKDVLAEINKNIKRIETMR